MIEVKCYASRCGQVRDVEVELKDVDFSPVQWWVAVYSMGNYKGSDRVLRFQASSVDNAVALAQRDRPTAPAVLVSVAAEIYRSPGASA
jgi:hypothetical protein